jgi:hypothetical protein
MLQQVVVVVLLALTQTDSLQAEEAVQALQWHFGEHQ